MTNNGKYIWTHKSLDSWLKQQTELLEKAGFANQGTVATGNLLVEKVIKPNNINLAELVKPCIKLNRKWKRQVI